MLFLSKIIVAAALFISTTNAVPIDTNSLVTRGKTNDGEGIFHACPTVDDLMNYIAHKNSGSRTIDNVVFWSYPGNGNIAMLNGGPAVKGKCLYDFIHTLDVDDWVKLYCSKEGGKVVWARASYAIAMMSRGTAYLMAGTGAQAPKADSIWATIEEPVLKAHGQVTSIVRMDPMTAKIDKAEPPLWKQDGTKYAMPKPPP